jgi:hypothetical protein
MFRKRIDIALAALLMLTMFGMGGVTIAQHGRELAYAITKGYANYIKEDGQPLASVKARVSAITSTINHTLPGVDQLERYNILFQMSLGKQIMSVGGQTMVKLKTGQLYDLLGNTNMQDDVAKMAKLKENLDAMGIPMLYVYPHSYIYEEGMLPDGAKDYNIEDADELVGGLKAAGIPVVDSRDAFKAAGLTIDQAIYRTDQHWATPELFATFQQTCEKLNEPPTVSPPRPIPRCTWARWANGWAPSTSRRTTLSCCSPATTRCCTKELSMAPTPARRMAPSTTCSTGSWWTTPSGTARPTCTAYSATTTRKTGTSTTR